MLGDGISRMNCEYFPWKTLAKVASNRVAELKDGDGKVEQKLKAIQNTRYSRIRLCSHDAGTKNCRLISSLFCIVYTIPVNFIRCEDNKSNSPF